MSRSSDGKLFHTVGPETAKHAQLPSFLAVAADTAVDDLSRYLLLSTHLFTEQQTRAKLRVLIGTAQYMNEKLNSNAKSESLCARKRNLSA